MRLLGALAPNTEDRMNVGANKTVLAAAALLRNCRRLMASFFLVLRLFSFLPAFPDVNL